MKVRNGSLLIGLAALALCGSAIAHDDRAYGGYPDGHWSGNAAVWGASGGYSGWSGNLSNSSGYGYAPGYIPWLAAVPHGHRHGPACHHVPRYGHHRKHWKGHGHDRGHRNRSGKGYHRHH